MLPKLVSSPATFGRSVKPADLQSVSFQSVANALQQKGSNATRAEVLAPAKKGVRETFDLKLEDETPKDPGKFLNAHSFFSPALTL
jgi:hypothetical protein